MVLALLGAATADAVASGARCGVLAVQCHGRAYRAAARPSRTASTWGHDPAFARPARRRTQAAHRGPVPRWRCVFLRRALGFGQHYHDARAQDRLAVHSVASTRDG